LLTSKWIKAVRACPPVYEAQLLSHLRLSGKRIGLLINFRAMHLKDGIKRMINDPI
jgi:GxxExxY protein